MAEQALPPIEIEVVFAGPDAQWLHRIHVEVGSTAAEAVVAAGLAAHWNPQAEVRLPLACFGRLIAADYRVQAGDRVEILRALDADPKDQRHLRVKAARKARRRAASAA